MLAGVTRNLSTKLYSLKVEENLGSRGRIQIESGKETETTG